VSTLCETRALLAIFFAWNVKVIIVPLIDTDDNVDVCNVRRKILLDFCDFAILDDPAQISISLISDYLIKRYHFDNVNKIINSRCLMYGKKD